MLRFIQKEIDKRYTPIEEYEKLIEEHKELNQKMEDLKGEYKMMKSVFGVFYDIIDRWRNNKIGNLRAVNSISRIMLGKKEKETK
tara:strand:- start:390 stop:644 length:255 start_codon:yes stop_codon:yes gene_type:complete